MHSAPLDSAAVRSILAAVDAALGAADENAAALAAADENAAALQAVCALLADRVAHYDWVGFYLVDPAAPRELVLGPYVGAPTDHVRIPFGRGVCGQAAERGETVVVQDVSRETNYLSCSVHVRSEIVVPIRDGDRVLGEIDIDSHALQPFGEADRQLLEAVAARVAPRLG